MLTSRLDAIGRSAVVAVPAWANRSVGVLKRVAASDSVERPRHDFGFAFGSVVSRIRRHPLASRTEAVLDANYSPASPVYAGRVSRLSAILRHVCNANKNAGKM